ncbi:MAG: thiamine-binding protein [Desulfobulbaceae bacterium]|nr:MAG: thiamine-binding protein [Desulfobulbaceae bacterium]
MKVIIDLCIIPLGVGVSVSDYIAACHDILEDKNLQTNLHAYGTNIEGEWDTVMAAVKKCHEKIHEMGAPRISTQIKLGTRTDREQTMLDKINSVTTKRKSSG